MDEEIKQSRKAFFKKTFGLFRKGISAQIDRKLTKILEAPLRPPGALQEVEFLSTCTRCDACKEACPHFAIQLMPASKGLAAQTPYIEPKQQPCHLCRDLPCIASCEPRALLPVAHHQVNMGKAFITETRCFTYQETICTLCYDACPFPEKAISIIEYKAHVLTACTGCGLCEYHCPTMPASIQIKSPYQMRKQELEDQII